MQRYVIIILSLFSLGLLMMTCQSKGGKTPQGKTELPAYDAKALFSDILAKPVSVKMPAGLKGDAKNGHKLFTDTKRGNCAACHCAPNATGCGNIGPTLDGFASRMKELKYSDQWLFDRLADSRLHAIEEKRDTVMPPTLPTKVLSPKEIVDVMAYLKTLK